MFLPLLLASITSHDAVALATNGDLYELNYAAASATLIGNIGSADVHALARDGSGVLWSYLTVDALTVRLITIDETNASTTSIGNVTSGGSVRAMAFDRDGSLLMISRPVGLPDQLRRVNLNTLSSTPILNTGLFHVEGLVVAPEGKIYAWDVGPGGANGAGLVELVLAGAQVLDVSGTLGDDDVLGLSLDEVGELIGIGSKASRVTRDDGVHSPISGDFGLEFEAIEPLVQMSSFDGAFALGTDGALTRFNTTTGAGLTYDSLGATGFVGFSRRNLPLGYFAARDAGATTELCSVDTSDGSYTVVTSLPFFNVRAMDITPTGVFIFVEDGGLGNDDLIYVFNLATSSIGGPYPILGASNVEAIVFNPMDDYWVWDDQRGLLYAVYGGQNFEVVPGPTSEGPFDASDFNADGRLYLNGNRVYSAHIPSETYSALPTSLGSTAGIAFMREYSVQGPSIYCTSQTNSGGCVPVMSVSGVDVPSVSSGSGFVLKAFAVLGQKQGLLFYGLNGRNSAPFLGGTMCVKAPVRRTPAQSSGGTSTGCTGVFSLDFNAYIAGGSDPALIPGALVHCQWWSRDPAAPSTTNLTNAVDFGISP
jgi:hypothetical protein